MAINRFTVESYMDAMELRYFTREEGSDTNWALLFGDNVGLMIRLTEAGEYLLLRNFPLLNVKQLSEAERSNLVSYLLKRNDGLKLGHYSADESVVFETGIPIEDGEFTANQLKRCLGAVVSEINGFKERLATICTGGEPVPEIDKLMDRIIEGGQG